MCLELCCGTEILHAAKAGIEVVLTMHLLSEGWRGEMFPLGPFHGGCKGARMNPSVL